MKLLMVSLCAFLLGAAAVIASPIDQHHQQQQQQQRQHLLGARECTWGPSYWCYNITNAAGCGAVTHCIQTVWEKHAVPEDTDSICKICLDMVQQARDQLLSNGTQEDLKAVFEGSCLLIPLKPIAKMCIRTVDNFIPELVEALSSQMDPQAVCSIAGLCNNAGIDKMLADAASVQSIEGSSYNVATSVQATPVTAGGQLTCKQCTSVGGIISQKLRSADRDQLLAAVLQQCGRMSSFSDACASLVLRHFGAVYDHSVKYLTGENICHLAGTCVARYHQHEGDDNDDDDDDDMPLTPEQLQLEIRPMGAVGVVKVTDDIPCELCKQLVHHLKDLLIANTTEIEFKSVLEGLCKQTGTFKSECLSIVDQYYMQIYNTLLTDLDENEACCLIEICPRGLHQSAADASGDLMPLLPAAQAQHLYVSITAKPKVHRPLLGANEPTLTNLEIQQSQLPIDTLLGAPNGGQLIEGGNLCVVCEYAAHFVQTALANTQTEAEIKDYMKTVCLKVTPKLRAQCDSFIDTYGDALIALAIQEVDPREICPRLFVCPAAGAEVASEILPLDAVQINERRGSAGNQCPMCLFAVAQAIEAVKTDRSVANIESVLARLCATLPGKMKAECDDFVATYTRELVRMLADDFTPQAICTSLKLCDPEAAPTAPTTPTTPTPSLSNELFDFDDLETVIVDTAAPNCLLCEEFIKQVEKHVSNKKSRAQIKEALEHACARMAKLTAKCDLLVERYGDRIVDLLMAEFTPKQICRELGQCVIGDVQLIMADNAWQRRIEKQQQQQLQLQSTPAVAEADADMAYVHAADTTTCVLCQTVMTQLEKELQDKTTQKEIEDVVKNICHTLPAKYDAQCSTFIQQYAQLIIALVDTMPPKEICKSLSLCATPADMLAVVAETKLEVVECAVCHSATVAMVRVLEDPKVQRNVEHVIDRTCNMLPAAYNDRCIAMVEAYGQSMLNIIANSSELQTLCTKIGMCHPNEYRSFAQLSGQ